MAWVETRITRTSQPQDACGIDWSNPLSHGLVSCFIPGLSDRDFVSGSVSTYEGGQKTKSVTEVGVNTKTNPTRVRTNSLPQFANDLSFLWLGSVNAFSGTTGQVFNQRSSYADGGLTLGLAVVANTTIQFVAKAGANGDLRVAQSGVGFGLNQIRPIAGTLNGTSQKLFVDGVLRNSRTNTVTLVNQTVPVYIGALSTGTEALNANHAVLHIWNRGLSDDEVKSISENPWQIFEPEIARIWVDDYVSSGAITGNASGSLSAIGLSPVSGTASGAASASASIRAVSLSAVNGTASGASVASGVFAPISLNAINATANGSASASASLSPISLSPVNGTANGETVVAGNASGAFDDVAPSPVSGIANGAASATGALIAISLTDINGTASGGAIVAGNAAGAFDDVSLTALTGSASGGSAGIAAGVFASLSINQATGAAYGAAVAVGSLPVIALTQLKGSATGVSIIQAYASGAFDDITLSPLTGTAAVIRRIRPIVPNYNTMSVDASYNVAYIDPTYWID